MAKRRSVRGRKTAKGKGTEEKRLFLRNRLGKAEEKRLFLRNKLSKAEGKAKLARKLRPDQITVVGIQLDVPGHGRISLRPGGGAGGTDWDNDLSDNKADSDDTDQYFNMDGRDGITDMDPSDPIRRGGGGPIIA